MANKVCDCPCCNGSTSRVIIDGHCTQCGHVPGGPIEEPKVEGEKRLTRVQRRRMDRYVKKKIEQKGKEGTA